MDVLRKGARLMSGSLFNDKMTSAEARTVLFRAVEGKSKEEIEQIFNDYNKVHSIILHGELDLVSKGILTD